MPDPISGPVPRTTNYTGYTGGTDDAGPAAIVTAATPTGLADQENAVLPDAIRHIIEGRVDLVDPKFFTDQEMKEATGRLVGLLSSGVNLQEIAQIIQQTNLEMRKTMREDRAANRDMDIAKQKEAADKIRDQAAFAFAASVTMSAFAIVGSAVSIAGSVKGAKAGMDVDAPSATGAKAKGSAFDDANLPDDFSTPRPTGKRGGMIEDVNMPDDVRAATGRQGQAPDEADGPDSPQGRPRSNAVTSRDGGVEPGGTGKTSGEKSQAAASKLAKDKLDETSSEAAKPPVEDDGIPQSKLDALTEQNAIKRANLRQENIQNKFQATGTLITETGKIVGAALNYEAAMQEAEKADINAEASMARTRADDDSDYIKAYSDSIQAVIQKLSEMQSSEADSIRQIVRA